MLARPCRCALEQPRDTILPLPPKSPELNLVENLWLFMRENWLSNRLFKSYEDIVAHCCEQQIAIRLQERDSVTAHSRSGPLTFSAAQVLRMNLLLRAVAESLHLTRPPALRWLSPLPCGT